MDYSYLTDWARRAYKRSGGRGKELAFLFDEPNAQNDFIFDLHIHTTRSDGSRDAEKLEKEARENKVQIYVPTDHDALGSHDAMSGIEVTCKLGNEYVEVLLYGSASSPQETAAEERDFKYISRQYKIKKLLTLLTKRLEVVNAMNITNKKLTVSDFISIMRRQKEGSKKLVPVPVSEFGVNLNSTVESILNGDEPMIEKMKINGQIIDLCFDNFNSRLLAYINANENGEQYLRQHSSVSQDEPMGFAEFNRKFILNKDSPFYVPDDQYYPTVSQVCEHAKKYNKAAILAHPFGYPSASTPPEELMNKAVREGVDGIECMHGFNEADQIEKIYKFCYERDLLISAGSDVHNYYSTQGNETQVGYFPGQGVKSKFADRNILEGSKISTSNLHFIGSGEWRGEKQFDMDNQPQL